MMRTDEPNTPLKRLALLLCLGLMLSTAASASRIKDLCEIQGARGNILKGTGIVVGLAGTGDKAGAALRAQERMLRRLRHELLKRVMRFPLPQFRKTSQGEIVSMVTLETEPLGGFFGDSFSLPIFQGGQLLTLLVFMFVQNPILGIAAIALYPETFPDAYTEIIQVGRSR